MSPHYGECYAGHGTREKKVHGPCNRMLTADRACAQATVLIDYCQAKSIMGTR